MHAAQRSRGRAAVATEKFALRRHMIVCKTSHPSLTVSAHAAAEYREMSIYEIFNG